MNKEKVFAILNQTIWNDDNDSNVVAITKDVNIAQTIFHQLVGKVKKKLDFDNLYFVSNSQEIGYLYDEGKDYFFICTNGSEDDIYILIKISEHELVKEIKQEKEIEIN